jgi:hypothetical protein
MEGPADLLEDTFTEGRSEGFSVGILFDEGFALGFRVVCISLSSEILVDGGVFVDGLSGVRIADCAVDGISIEDIDDGSTPFFNFCSKKILL